MTAKKKPMKVAKHSPDLNLKGTPNDFVKKIKILKNILPPLNRWAGGKWDHLIVRLEEGDCIELETKLAYAFGNRARKLGYVIVIRKHTDDISRVWFEGWDASYQPKRRKSGGKK